MRENIFEAAIHDFNISISKKIEFKKGECWYVKLPNNSSHILSEKYIVSITEKTIELSDVPNLYSAIRPVRYKIADIDFVEKSNREDSHV